MQKMKQSLKVKIFHFFLEQRVDTCVCPTCLPADIHHCDPLISHPLSQDVGAQMLS